MQQESYAAWVSQVLRQVHDTEKTAEAKNEIRKAARELLAVMNHYAPKCADLSAATRKVREAVWTAEAAVDLDGLV